MKSYRELEVWQVAMSLAKDVYALVCNFPAEERFALANQMCRAAVSVPSNVAEGFGRETTKDLIHFLAMARGSLYELETQAQLAVDVGYCTIACVPNAKMERVARMLNALSAKLKDRLENASQTTSHEPRTTNHE